MTAKALAEAKAYFGRYAALDIADCRALLHDHELLLAVVTAASPYLGTCRGHGNFGCEGVCGRAALCAALRACGLGDADVTAPAEGVAK